MSITIFGNIFINDKLKLEMLKISFSSFNNSKIEKWVLNIRGKFKSETKDFLMKNIKQKKIFFELESDKGWFYDSRLMSKEINSEYVFNWIEDHVNLQNSEFFNSIINELKEIDGEYLMYSEFFFGEQLESYKKLKTFETNNLVYLNYDLNTHHQRINEIDYSKPINDKANRVRNKLAASKYIISMPSILKTNLFKKILKNKDLIFKRWPINTPFDFEKRPDDISWLPLKVACVKEEFFATIDDNHGFRGYSLIERKHPIVKKILLEKKTLSPNFSQKNDKNNILINIKKYFKEKINYIFHNIKYRLK